MWRYLAGVVAALLLMAAGAVLFNATGKRASLLPAMPLAAEAQTTGNEMLPDAVPEASDRTREQKRFDRYDKDRNGGVTREEYLASRRKAYARLDANHDGALSFDEWSAKTIGKFATADGDESGVLTPKEFATTAVKRSPHARQTCPPPQAAAAEES